MWRLFSQKALWLLALYILQPAEVVAEVVCDPAHLSVIQHLSQRASPPLVRFITQHNPTVLLRNHLLQLEAESSLQELLLVQVGQDQQLYVTQRNGSLLGLNPQTGAVLFAWQPEQLSHLLPPVSVQTQMQALPQPGANRSGAASVLVIAMTGSLEGLLVLQLGIQQLPQLSWQQIAETTAPSPSLGYPPSMQIAELAPSQWYVLWGVAGELLFYRLESGELSARTVLTTSPEPLSALGLVAEHRAGVATMAYVGGASGRLWRVNLAQALSGLESSGTLIFQGEPQQSIVLAPLALPLASPQHAPQLLVVFTAEQRQQNRSYVLGVRDSWMDQPTSTTVITSEQLLQQRVTVEQFEFNVLSEVGQLINGGLDWSRYAGWRLALLEGHFVVEPLLMLDKKLFLVARALDAEQCLTSAQHWLYGLEVSEQQVFNKAVFLAPEEPIQGHLITLEEAPELSVKRKNQQHLSLCSLSQCFTLGLEPRLSGRQSWRVIR